mmetsp:Transcript_88121/g.254208  ORF Transcript_88121/g.254208 Transcript_88121/m.254208 type:complete len:126 (+) Transcript_88121:930-1307(+)
MNLFGGTTSSHLVQGIAWNDYHFRNNLFGKMNFFGGTTSSDLVQTIPWHNVCFGDQPWQKMNFASFGNLDIGRRFPVHVFSVDVGLNIAGLEDNNVIVNINIIGIFDTLHKLRKMNPSVFFFADC